MVLIVVVAVDVETAASDFDDETTCVDVITVGSAADVFIPLVEVTQDDTMLLQLLVVAWAVRCCVVSVVDESDVMVVDSAEIRMLLSTWVDRLLALVAVVTVETGASVSSSGRNCPLMAVALADFELAW